MSDAAVRVDTTSQVPPYEQIRAQLAALIRTGRLAEGERLPTVRQLATDLGLAPGTVARAYRELEAAALIRTRRGAGTRVAPLPPDAHAHDADRLTVLARDFTSAARTLGADAENILTAVRDALEITPKPKAKPQPKAKPRTAPGPGPKPDADADAGAGAVPATAARATGHPADSE
ncbi:GntR family transcriptional regulator [Streptomyces kroppenstedtii]|jgi:GntR family transcriptional regulator|uniref:GntR family transcriptional regulator n=1 Tax=Streptomyces kroppenstedtii TaxID=3051181 RepID=UPI003F9E7106